jgi:hypothetical protein
MIHADIKEIMERWARWRYYQAWHELGYGECVSGKLLDGIKRIQCPGLGCTKGSVPVVVNKQKFWLPCTQCMGSGYISAKSTATKINPKLIRGTGGRYPDEQSLRVDRLVCRLHKEVHKKARRVVLQEYDWTGTQEIKAGRLRITHENYRKILQRSHEFIEVGLTGVTNRAING